MRYDAILYDLDGTLVDSVPLIVKCMKQAYINVLGNCPRSEADLMSYIGKPLLACFGMHSAELTNKLGQEYLKINCKLLEQNVVPPFDGVVEGLDGLRKLGAMQGLVTSKRYSSAIITIEHLELGKFFEHMIFSEDSSKHKPNPEPLFLAASKFGITDMSRILYVGDALPDIECAKGAGCDFAFVEWSQMPREEIMRLNPTYCLKSFSMLSCIMSEREL